MKLVNLTPHALTIRTTTADIVLPPSGTVARVSEARHPAKPVSTDDGIVIATSRATYGEITGLPSIKYGTIYVVSGMVLDALRRANCPYTCYASPGPLIRDDKGQPVACDGLTVLE